jgi:hypothetical protein
LLRHRIVLCLRVDERDQLAAAHHELIERIQRCGRQIARMNDGQNVEIGRNGCNVSRSRLHREQLVQLRNARPARTHLAAHLVETRLDR